LVSGRSIYRVSYDTLLYLAVSMLSTLVKMLRLPL
jgi:hypothetical protein